MNGARVPLRACSFARVWAACLLVLAAGCESRGAASGAATTSGPPPMDQRVLQQQLNDLQSRHPDTPGFAIAVLTFAGGSVTAATGVADPAGRAMTASTPLRIASNTKTFVAAAVLRLWEQGQVDLDASIARYLSAAHTRLLREDGYPLDAISVRHLLMHGSGLADHFAGDAYKNAVLANPAREWTRTEQLQAW